MVTTRPDGRSWILKSVVYTDVTMGSRKAREGLIRSAFNVDVLLTAVYGTKTASLPFRFRLYPQEGLVYEAKLVSKGAHIELSKAAKSWLEKQSPPFIRSDAESRAIYNAIVVEMSVMF